MAQPIYNPKPTRVRYKTKDGMVEGTLRFNTSFAKDRNYSFRLAQMYIDEEVLRFCSSRVPLQTGALMLSGINNTIVGSGLVRYVIVYAAYQYYKTANSREYDARRGAQWFERGKIDERARIFAGAKRILGI